MFEGLDQVNWSKLRHANGTGEKIPDLLRTFAEAQNEDICSRTFDELLETIHYLGEIYDSTAATVPLLVQLLRISNSSKRVLILRAFTMFIEVCEWNVKNSQTIVGYENYFATFSNVARSVPIYISLLNDSNYEVRGLAAYLTARTNNQYPGASHRLWRASECEENPFVRAMMIYGAGHLVKWGSSYWTKKAREQYRERFVKVINSSEEPIVRLAAASAWLEATYTTNTTNTHSVPETVSLTVGNAIATQIHQTFPDEFRFPLFDDSSLLTRLLQVGSLGGLAEALSAKDMTAEAAHIIVQRLFDAAFAHTGPVTQYGVDKGQGSDKQYIYIRHPFVTDRRLYFPGKILDVAQEIVIRAAVNCEVFWQIPTNLFSFFYGLPDSRDKLRVLLTDSAQG